MSRILSLLKVTNALLDIFCLNIFFWGVLIMDYGGREFTFSNQAVVYMVMLNMIWILASGYFKIYDHYLVRDSVKIYNVTLKAFLVFTGFFFLISFFLVKKNDVYQTLSLRLRFYFIFLAAFFLALIFIRLVLLTIRKKARGNKRYKKRIVIVSSHAFSKMLTDRFLQDMHSPYEVLGVFYDKDSHRADYVNGQYGGTMDEYYSFIEQHKVDEVFCVLKEMRQETVQQLMRAADRNVARFRMVLDIYDYLGQPADVEMRNSIPVIRARQEPLEKPENAFSKRLFDIVFSMLVIVFILSWLLPILAICIKLESKGPVFFKQKRSGRHNEPFSCIKFRSMRVNTEANSKQAVKNDCRITKVGRFLRKTSLDELPQFFNVLMGHMSVVGPRPHMLAHTEEYSSLIDEFMVRHFVMPGITGWAQVNGFRGETRALEDMKKRVEADVWYLENWSLLLDMKIIFLTVWNVVRGDEKAY